jgi:hypothetical protein
MGWIQRHDEDADCSVHPWMPQTTTSATVSIANTNNDCCTMVWFRSRWCSDMVM